MANEYSNLQKHISERATNLLAQAKSFEEMNRNKILSGIVEGANAELDRVSDLGVIFNKISKGFGWSSI